MEHTLQGRHPHLPNKTWRHDTTWHLRYRYLVSSGGPYLPYPDRNWKEPPVTRFLFIWKQSINESDELRGSTTVTSSTKTTSIARIRSTFDCKTTYHVTRERFSSSAPQSSIRSHGVRPAGLQQHEIFTRFLHV